MNAPDNDDDDVLARTVSEARPDGPAVAPGHSQVPSAAGQWQERPVAGAAHTAGVANSGTAAQMDAPSTVSATGYTAGSATGSAAGYAEGSATNYDAGNTTGHAAGYDTGNARGTAAGNATGHATSDASGNASGDDAGHGSRNDAHSAAGGRRGFGHSWRRLIIELVVIAGLLLGLVFVSFRLASYAAGTLVRWVPTSVDVAVGSAVAPMLSRRCDDPVAQAYVQALLDSLLVAADDRRFAFDISVADDAAVNAFALPGGIVVVNRGLLEKAETGEEVAGVLAHEIQHVLRRHGMVGVLREAGGKMILGMVLGWADVADLTGYAGSLLQLSYGRDQEREADRLGRAIMKKAGMDPRGLAHFFARLAAEGGPQPPAILSTHPGHGERVRDAEADAAGFTPTRVLPPPPRPIVCR